MRKQFIKCPRKYIFMEITLEELFKGKATKIKNKQFFSTEQYVEPFLERMQKYTSDFRVQVKLPDQITTDINGNIITDDITYNRVYIQAVLPEEYTFNNHKEVIGMVYGIDTRKPIAKFFKGALNCACTNLCVFNPDALAIQEIAPETAINFKPLTRIAEMTSDVAQWLNTLSNTQFITNEQNINEHLGQWVRNSMNYEYDNGFGKVKIANSIPIDAYKLLFEKEDSPYYTGFGKDLSMFTVYNAFTQLLTDGLKKDVISQCEKTLLLKDILTL